MKTPTRRRAIAAATSIAVLALALAGCSPSSGGTSSDSATKVLRLGATAGPVSLDPALQSVDPTNNWFINLAYDPLIRLDSNGDLQPDLATEWKYTDDTSTVFELTLRDGVTFSDGSALTGDAVKSSLEYMITSGVNGANWLSSIASIAADGQTVTISLNEPNSALPYLLSQRLLLGSVISPAGVSDPDSIKSATSGVGPYVLDTERTVANDTYVYVPNESYWDASKIKWDEVEIKVVATSSAELQAVQSGELDLFASDAATSTAASSTDLSVIDATNAIFGVNYGDRDGTLVPALADPRVRQALSYAIDRTSIATALLGDFGGPNAALTLESFAGYSADDAAAFPYDPEKAKELLAEAGYADGFSFDMGSMTLAGTADMAQAIVENWKAIGVTANLTTYDDLNALVTDFLAKKYPVTTYAYGVLPTYIQAKSFFSGGATQYNPWNTTDAEISADIQAANQAASVDDQNALYQKALHRATVDLAWMSNVMEAANSFVYNPATITGVSIVPSSATPDVAWEVAPAE